MNSPSRIQQSFFLLPVLSSYRNKFQYHSRQDKSKTNVFLLRRKTFPIILFSVQNWFLKRRNSFEVCIIKIFVYLQLSHTVSIGTERIEVKQQYACKVGDRLF